MGSLSNANIRPGHLNRVTCLNFFPAKFAMVATFKEKLFGKFRLESGEYSAKNFLFNLHYSIQSL